METHCQTSSSLGRNSIDLGHIALSGSWQTRFGDGHSCSSSEPVFDRSRTLFASAFSVFPLSNVCASYSSLERVEFRFGAVGKRSVSSSVWPCSGESPFSVSLRDDVVSTRFPSCILLAFVVFCLIRQWMQKFAPVTSFGTRNRKRMWAALNKFSFDEFAHWWWSWSSHRLLCCGLLCGKTKRHSIRIRFVVVAQCAAKYRIGCS